MGIPIITELNREITRLYIAGSPLAKGDPRIAKYIEPLTALGQRAPVFQVLAARLGELTQGEEQASPEQLMEAGMLVNSVIYTQGSTELKEETQVVVFGEEPLNPAKLPYSQLHQLLQILGRQSQEHSAELIQAYESGRYRDPRLYQAYSRAITERKSFVSDFVAETIIPALGREMIPFLERELDLAGGRRDARVFKALYRIKGTDILPQSLEALAKESLPVMTEALYTLGEDPQYETILVDYARDKRAELRQAAFTTLERMGSDKAEAMILEGLSGKSVSHLAEVLIETGNPVLVRAVLAQVKQDMPEFAGKAAKLKCLLEVLAVRDEPEGLEYLKSLYLEQKFFDEIAGKLDLRHLVETLYWEKKTSKDQIVFEIACRNEVFMQYKLYTAKRLYAPEQVYELCYQDCQKHKEMLEALRNTYRFYDSVPDADKPWDHRWAHVFLQKDRIEYAYISLYDHDYEGWNKLLEMTLALITRKKTTPVSYLRYLKKAKTVGLPGFDKYYEQFLAAGYTKEVLAEQVL